MEGDESSDIKVQISPIIEVKNDEDENIKSPNEIKTNENNSPQLLLMPNDKLKQNNIRMETNYSGSATGNPRNKCALKPGHSLMDWIRLGSSGVDLSGTKGQIIKVSHAELAKHNSRDNAWLAIRGKVYNVTKYMDFHPGGVDELMRGVGIDATKLFEEVHAWVNYEQLLSKSYIGPLKTTAMLTIKEEKSSTSFKFPSFKLSNNSRDNAALNKSPESEEIIPRFDWIQKTSDIDIIFYTKSLCNPGVIVECINDFMINVRIIIKNITHWYQLKFSNPITWPCIINSSLETGKIEIILTKLNPELWTNYGSYEKKKVIETEILEYDYQIINIESISSDSFVVTLNPQKQIMQLIPVGYHFNITAHIDAMDITRSYTPVPSQFITQHNASTSIPFLIKSYETGTLSKYITQNPFLTSPFKISQPKGNFSISKLKTHVRIGLLAAGSGLTPMLSLLEYLLLRRTNKIESVILLYFNKTESDIWCRDQLNSIAVNDERLKLRFILSRGSEEWNGETGIITKTIVTSLNDRKSTDNITFAFVCGPPQFNDVTEKLFKESGFKSEYVHCFRG